MADDHRTGIDQATSDGEKMEEHAATFNGDDRRRLNFDEIERSFERARQELNEAVRNFRAELGKIDVESARRKAQSWVDENPTLAVMIGVGAGIVVGRAVARAMRPDPLPVRARKQIRAIMGEAGHVAGDLGGSIAHQLSRAAHTASRATHRGSDLAEELSRRAERTGRDLSKSAGAMRKDATRRAEELADAISETSSRTLHDLEDTLDDLTKTLNKRTKKARKSAARNVERGMKLSETVVNAARTAVAAVALKKANDWLRRMR